MSVIVTIGAHHRGAHVDELLKLAEQVGAFVMRVNTPESRQAKLSAAKPRRVSYAGKDQHDYSSTQNWGGQA